METESEVLEADYEHEQQERLGQIEAGVLEHYKERRLPIGQEELRLLMPSVELADLDNDEVKANYRLDKIFAHVDTDGNVKFNRNEFFNRSEAKQRHSYSHELGHRFDWMFRSAQLQDDGGALAENYSEALEAMRKLTPEKISLHTYKTNERLKGRPEKGETEHPDRVKMVEMEAMAELISYYTDCDGSFKGMLEEMLAGNADGGEKYWLANEEARNQMEELGEFDNWTEEQQMHFFDRNPQYTDLFHVYAHLRNIFNNHELMEELFDDIAGYEDPAEIWEDTSLAQTQPAPSNAQQQGIPPKEEGKFDWWAVFRLF